MPPIKPLLLPAAICLVILVLTTVASNVARSDYQEIVDASNAKLTTVRGLHERVQESGDTAQVTYCDAYQLCYLVTTLKREPTSGSWQPVRGQYLR